MIDRKLFKVTTSIGTISLFSITIPLLIQQIINSLLGTVNTIVLSGYSEDAVSAVGTAATLISVFEGFLMMGSRIIISHYIGADDMKRVKETSFVTIILCSAVAVIISMITLPFRYQIMSFMNLEGKILEDAVSYFEIIMTFFILVAINYALSNILYCYGYVFFTFIAGLITNIVNLLLCIFVIYSGISPITGVSGVAAACVISQFAGMLVYVALIIRFKIEIRRPENIKDFLAYMGKLLRVGVPSSVSGTSYLLSQAITTLFVALIGMHALNGRVYFSTILSYVCLFSYNIGNANALLVGRLYGAGRMEQADKANRQLVLITILVNLSLSVTVFLLRIPLVSMFTDNQEILRLSFGIMLIDILVELARAVSHVYEYALEAVGDVMFKVIAIMISCWCLNIGLGYILGIRFGMGLIGVWIGLAVDESIRGIVTYFRWKYLRKRNFMLK